MANWSSKWNEPVSVGKDERSDAQKIHDDAVMFGTGYSIDGKHIPIEDVLIEQHETRTIKLGNKTIQVIVVGDLGLDFCEPGEKDEGWNIYHLPTLACFSSAVPQNANWDGVSKKFQFEFDNQVLLNWMAKVQFECNSVVSLAWGSLRKLTPSNYSDNGGTAKDIIKNWCLSVKVE